MKYLGSKARVVKDIVPIIQRYIDETGANTYVEPFVGGANVIDKIKCDHKIGIDKDKYLIALLKRVQNKLPLLDQVPKDLYDQARDMYYNKENYPIEDWQIGCIGYLASYNGRGFSGGYAKSGHEITKKGERFRDYYRESKDNLEKQASYRGFKDINFVCGDYLEYQDFKNCVIYCDPPYEGAKGYEKHLTINYVEFWNYVREMSENNIVIVSELNAPDDFECIWSQEVSRSIKAKNKSRDIEKLFIMRQVEQEDIDLFGIDD